MLLTRIQKASLDLSDYAEVLSYTYAGDRPAIILVRVDIGDEDKPISGGGEYALRTTLNDSRLSPDSAVNVPAGVPSAVIQSRHLILAPGDTLKIEARGRNIDTDVDTDTRLMDMTPATVSDIAGIGAVAVDHNYGGTDALAYRTGEGRGIDNATIHAFLKCDYDKGRRSAKYIQGESRTNVQGRWMFPIMLDPGNYKLVFFVQGRYGPNVKTIKVS
jgi:hypothetical protein